MYLVPNVQIFLWDVLYLEPGSIFDASYATLADVLVSIWEWTGYRKETTKWQTPEKCSLPFQVLWNLRFTQISWDRKLAARWMSGEHNAVYTFNIITITLYKHIQFVLIMMLTSVGFFQDDQVFKSLLSIFLLPMFIIVSFVFINFFSCISTIFLPYACTLFSSLGKFYNCENISR